MNSNYPNEPVIVFEGVSVRYRVPHERMSGLKEYAIRWVQRRLKYDDFWALRGISFEVPQGQIFGVIGRNGAGKSTMLKVMARVLQPTEGRFMMRGKIAPLLELGAGFHPELTGRENIYLNSALLGHSHRDVETRFDSIVDFAEVGDFIEAPLRTYSTGMVARLGFAVATSVRPDILLVDEVLSVGDAPFQKKCLDRMYEFQQEGTTIVIVSHSMATIETFCSRAIWINKGKAEIIGPAGEVIRHYIDRSRKPEEPPMETAPAPTIVEALQEPADLEDFTPLEQPGHIYPAGEIFNAEHGAVSAWVKASGSLPIQDSILFHTDDSRYVLFASSYFDEQLEQYVRVVIGRAGGNRSVINTFYGRSSFPESAAVLDHLEAENVPETPGDWRMVTLTWSGYPEGLGRLYLDGILMGEATYNRQYNDSRPLPAEIAVGMRPPAWTGELIESEAGEVVESRPESNMSIEDGGLEIRDMRLYRQNLSPEDVFILYKLSSEQTA